MMVPATPNPNRNGQVAARPPDAPTMVAERPSVAPRVVPAAPLTIPLTVDRGCNTPSRRPITVGLPFPEGALADPEALSLRGPTGRPAPLQHRALARWPSGSVKWLLLDFIDGPSRSRWSDWSLVASAGASGEAGASPLIVEGTSDAIEVDTGAVRFRINRRSFPLAGARVDGQEVLDPASTRLRLVDRFGRGRAPRIGPIAVEEAGPVRATVRLEGWFPGPSSCRFVARLCFFEGTGLVRARLTIVNPRRARHAGGLWDLGDPGSVHFRDLSLIVGLAGPDEMTVSWTAEAGQTPQSISGGPLEIEQDSSGGERWRSRNHVDHRGHVPRTLRGYRVRRGRIDERGLRAEPVLSIRSHRGQLTAAVPEFWQQFPKVIAAEGRALRLGLFPERPDGDFELQGGEQKTHSVWLHVGPPDSGPIEPLAWARRPARAFAAPGWYEGSGAVPFLAAPAETPAPRTEALLGKVIGGDQGLFARREIIDEYGWRNYGEVYADHEEAHYDGPRPIISHYNNQYDMVLGFAVHALRTGDGRWDELYNALARHVIDIDIYHTDRDRAAYNGGLFWHTDHYRDAATATHRAYSAANRGPGRRPYGGGPSNEHNYSTGLLLYHYLTGDPMAREAVVRLADWVVAMDDGSRTVLGLIDDGPTGLASRTLDADFHGPGRGAGNSVNALLDAWLLTEGPGYLAKAEELIRRAVHPSDDVPALGLLDAERRWSYTVFLSALARYLGLKAEAGQLDLSYAHGQAALAHYARWMLDHEGPYLDHPDRLEYPTETWAAQDLRKANVLRLASAHVDEPLRSAFLRKADALADRAWGDLAGFKSRTATRAVAIVMLEGLRDEQSRRRPPAPAPRPPAPGPIGRPSAFVPQKRRALDQLRSPRGALVAAGRLADPRRWARYMGWLDLPERRQPRSR